MGYRPDGVNPSRRLHWRPVPMQRWRTLSPGSRSARLNPASLLETVLETSRTLLGLELGECPVHVGPV